MSDKQTTERQFPILGTWISGQRWAGGSIPWSLIAPHEAQASCNHGGQTLGRLAERGGLSWAEAHAVLHDRPLQGMDPDDAKREVMEMVAAHV